MEAIVFVTLQIFIATRKLENNTRIFVNLSWEIFSHVTRSDQLRPKICDGLYWLVTEIQWTSKKARNALSEAKKSNNHMKKCLLSNWHFIEKFTQVYDVTIKFILHKWLQSTIQRCLIVWFLLLLLLSSLFSGFLSLFSFLLLFLAVWS